MKHINKYKMAHCVSVAEFMRERAADYNINSDIAYIVGLLHDVGYLQGRVGHEIYGAQLLRNLGVYEEACFAIEHHGESLCDIEREFGTNAISSLLVLLIEADSSVDATGVRVGFVGRLKDIAKRYGKQHKAYEVVKNNINFVIHYCNTHNISMKCTRWSY